MSITTALNSSVSSTVNNSVKSTTSASTVSKTSTTSAETSKTENGFADMFAQAVNAVPSQTLSPEVLQATLPTTTIQTSNYVFDPLGVVGTVPESNTFLQAIRQMMGKPFEPAASPVIAAQAEPAAITPQATTPALISATAANSTTITPPVSTAVSKPATTSTSTSTNDFLDSLEAQLNYQGLSTATVAATATATPTTSPVVANTASDMLTQYMSTATSAVSATNIETTLVDALNPEPEEQAG
jgi:hypothetical protein